jgi:hypothetical protein
MVMDIEWFGAVLFTVIIVGTAMGVAASNTSLPDFPGPESCMVFDFPKDGSSSVSDSAAFRITETPVIWVLSEN